ncbi:site-specific integrase, partial [Xenorhabdus bovienii]|uniref:site-specific integrase n=2 Tax=Xenorhabdus TaxID=626 RepID=UPI0023B21030
REWQGLDPAKVRIFASRSRRAGLESASLALRLSALRSFLDWMVMQGKLGANPAKAVSAPRKKRHLPKNMDVDEVNQLLNINFNDPLSVRDR